MTTRRDRLASMAAHDATEMLREAAALARPLATDADLGPLLDRIGEAHIALLGEASHGTSEFYTWRASISKRLIQERGFRFIAVEGDWPDCYRVNRYIKGYDDAGASAYDVLYAFDRWPTWMWANQEIVELVEWLRAYNAGRPREEKVGFYGLDVYSLWDSMKAVVDYLERTDPPAAQAAKRAYRCFEPFNEDEQSYAAATRFVPLSCEDEVVGMLSLLRQRVPQHPTDPEAAFDAEQNALITVNAERYYRIMMRGGPESWNIRDTHMTDTLERLMRFHGPDARAIVWEHNTHIGDARATDMAGGGMVNIGQLMRERRGAGDVALVGFGTHRGSVIAGPEWGAPMQRMTVPPARAGSIEDMLHRDGLRDQLLIFAPSAFRSGLLNERFPYEQRDLHGLFEPRGHRAIGVVYHPALEALGNYVPTSLPLRYDAFVFIDETQALRPLHLREAVLEKIPETYPMGV